jgi:paraquat-inducible protein B
MSKQANKTAIGVFVVVALALAVAAVIVFGSGKFFVERDMYVAYFQGSVKGLRVGAPLVFRGVQIGAVTDIRLYSDARDMSIEIPVLMQVEPERFHNIGPEIEDYDRQQSLEELIKRGLRAQLQMQSPLTGQLMINLDFYPDKPVRLRKSAGLDLGKDVLELPTIRTPLQRLEQTLEEVPLGDLAKSIKNSLTGIERMVNSPETTQSLENLRETLKHARDFLSHVNAKIDPLFADFEQTLKDAQALLRKVESQVDPLAGGIKRAADRAGAAMGDARKLLKNVNKRVEPIHTDLARTGKSLRSALKASEETIESIDGMVSEHSEFRFELELLLREVTLAARSLRAFADYLERNPDALLRGKTRRVGQK